MSNNKYLKLPIKGMHCRSCEILLEEKLQEVRQVKKVETNYRTGEAKVFYEDSEPPRAALSQAVVDAGYSIGQAEKLPWITSKGGEYRSLSVSLLILLALYFILNITGLTSIGLGADLSNPSWGVVILIGLVAGFSTCMAMVGGLSLGLSTKFSENHPEATAAQKFRPHLFFMAGRIISYAVLGGILGAIGSVLRFSALTNAIISILVGVVMLLMGLQLIGIFPRFSNFKLTLPKGISKALGITHKSREYSHGQAMLMGALTFFLPCGFTQAMQLYAVSTGNFWSGALVMGLFALGTAPGLLSIGGFTALVRGSFKKRFFQFAGLAVLAFAFFNLHNGFTLASLGLGSPSNSVGQEEQSTDPNVTLENGVQVVRMTEGNRGYSPNQFSIKKGVPVKWIIDAQAPYSCASTIVIPQLGITKTLEAGENTIEFTPSETGDLPFSCSMGMYTGSFSVYDSQSVSDSQPAAASSSTSTGCGFKNNTTTSGGACGGGAKVATNAAATTATADAKVQVLKTTFTQADDIQPNRFTVKAGQPVRMEVFAKEDGVGCMSHIEVQNLYNQPQLLQAGQTTVMEFTPQQPGEYLITCAMGVVRGWLEVK